MFDCNAAEARQFIVQKQALELGLAWDLYEVFSNEFLKPLQRACGEAVKEIDKNFGSDSRFQADYRKEWAGYACMRGLKNWDGHRLYQWTWKWSPFECGDWIRVYGEIVEMRGKYFAAGVDDDRTAPQRSFATDPGLGHEYQLWGKHQKKGHGGGSLDQGHRNPDNLRRRAQPKALHGRQTYEYDRLYGPPTPARELATSMAHSGIKAWTILDNDLTGKIDRYFGLMRGATISGTTTDNIFFLNKFGNVDTGHFRHTAVFSDRIFALMPIATIGAAGHHSLLEIALPLAINGYIDYSIGLYGSLFPTAYRPIAETRDGAEAIRGFLANYDSRGSEHLALCYYDDRRQLAGCYIAEHRDLPNWRYRFKVASQPFLQLFAGLPAYPTKDVTHALGLAMGLSMPG